MELVELVNWRGQLLTNPDISPVRTQYNFGPFEVAGFDRIILHQRVFPNTGGQWSTPDVRVGVMSGASADVGSGVGDESLFELTGFAGYRPAHQIAAVAERANVQPQAGAVDEIRFAVPIDDPYVLIGIASKNSDDPQMQLTAYAAVGGTYDPNPHLHGSLELLAAEPVFAGVASLDLPLPPYGGRLRYHIYQDTPGPHADVYLATESGFDSRPLELRHIFNPNVDVETTGELSVPWLQNFVRISATGACKVHVFMEEIR